jgi:fibronectin-binding autotransporter adhesin
VLTSNTSALGSGPLVMASPTTGPFNNTVNSPTIDATAVPQGVTLGNAVTFQGGALLNFKGSVNFSNLQNVNGSVTVNTTQDSDQLGLNGTVQGNGSLVVDGDGTTTVTGTLTAGVGLIAAATLSGTLNVGTNLQGGIAQVTVSGGTLGLLAGASGSGGIHVVGGTLVTDATPGAGGSAGYKGTISLENGGTIHDYDATDAKGLGTGNLDLRGGLLQNTSNDTAILSNPVTVTGSATVSSRGQRFKLNGSVDIGQGDSLDVFGTLVLDGPMTGSGGIILDGDELAVAGSNPTFSGNIVVNSGIITVTKNDALGTGPLFVNLKAKGLLESVDTISDPILDNAVTVNGGTLNLQGLLTFPKGVTVKSGTTLDIEGASSQVVISGPLAGSGNVVIGSGNLTMPGGSASFTGGFSLKADINRDGIVDAKDLKLLNAAMGTAGAQPEDGDANGDGSVGFADLVAVAQHYGQHNATLAKGDFNGDGTVDFTDLVAIAQHYAHSGPADLNGDGIVNFEDFQLLELAYGLTLPVGASVPAPASVELAPAAEPAGLPAPLVSSAQLATPATATVLAAALPSPAKTVVVRKDESGTGSTLRLLVRRPVLKSMKGKSNGLTARPIFSTVPITAKVQPARRRILNELLQ